MEVEMINSTSKRPRRDDDEKEVEVKGGGSLLPWQCPSSRIIRVSRISGGKDRHSKVWTAKGLRDRRVRLSVSTAIQFYDLQDRLGYDQPSKAVDWLIKAASSAIDGLPELEGSFPMPPPMVHPCRAKLPARVAMAAEQQQFSQSKSTCSSTSETSKGSVLSLSRCEGRGKARERARERAAREKEMHKESTHQHENLNIQNSFTELLVTGGGCGGSSVAAATAADVVDCGGGFDQKQLRLPQATLTPDYFGQSGVFGHAHKIPPLAPGFSSLLHFGNNTHMGMGVMAYNAAAAAGEHQEMQQLSFMQDHVIPVAAMAHGGDYDLNVSISSGIAGFSRGTLQSNSLHHHHLVDGANLPFFFSAALPIAASAGGSTENQYPGGFNGRLQLCCNEAHRHPELKGEGKG